MPRRLSFPADTPAADLADWIAAALAEGFTMPRVLPTLRRAPAEPPPLLPLMFEGLPLQRRGEPAVPPPPPPGMPLHEVMARHFAGVIAPKSALAQQRARLREKRAEVVAAAAQAASASAATAAPPASRAATSARSSWISEIVTGR